MGPNFYAVPAPGTVVIRFNGKVEADVGAGFTSLDKVTVPPGTAAFPASGGTYKTNPIAVGSYMRLYPGFDGMSANGIRYGAQIELRENFQPAQTTGDTTAVPSIASPSINSSARRCMSAAPIHTLPRIRSASFAWVRATVSWGCSTTVSLTAQCWDAGAGVFQNNAYGAFFPMSATVAGSTNFPWLAQSGFRFTGITSSFI